MSDARQEFIDWLVALDDPANVHERARTSLSDIIARARRADGGACAAEAKAEVGG